jgi:hypothetical protein
MNGHENYEELKWNGRYNNIHHENVLKNVSWG